jgi:hypothetical protein
MLVIAHHFIQDPDTFWSTAQQSTQSIPVTLKLHSVFPSEDLKTGTCVWEASDTETVQQFLDNTFGNSAKNVCYEVNEKIAFGLPQKTMEPVLS